MLVGVYLYIFIVWKCSISFFSYFIFYCFTNISNSYTYCFNTIAVLVIGLQLSKHIFIIIKIRIGSNLEHFYQEMFLIVIGILIDC